MFINKLQLKNFKRFTDLTIDLAPQQDENPPKLVLLIGANGSGKSCIFDAFEIVINKIEKKDSQYYCKPICHTLTYRDNPIVYNGNSIVYAIQSDFSVLIELDKKKLDYKYSDEKVIVMEAETNIDLEQKKFYGRSAFRYLPRLSKETIGQVKQETISQNLDRPRTYIDLDDKRFENDFDFLVTQTVYEIFNSQIPAQEKLDKINNLLSRVNSSLERIFGNNEKTSLKFKEFKTPSGGEPAKLLFQKGDSIIHYDLLSAGEKEVINIIFDLYVREPYFQDAIYFFDELDLHLNTSLQFDLLKEITEKWIPDNSQVWVASHSLGFIDYARQYKKGVIIDFDSLDFDQEQVLKPIDKHDPNKSYFNVALGENFIVNLVNELQKQNKEQIIVFSEGENYKLLEKAKNLLKPDLPVRFLDGGGKDNLKGAFMALQSSGNKILFIFDTDAKKEFNVCKGTKDNNLIPFLIPQNEKNTICSVGIENLFDIKFFEDSFIDREKFYTRKNDNKGGYSFELDKKRFCDYLLERNNKDDFANFNLLFNKISEVLKQCL